MVYAQSKIYPRKWDAQTPLGFCDINGFSNLGQTTRLRDGQKKKKNGENPLNNELCCSDWPQSKTEGKRKRDKYLELARELKKVWNLKVMVVPTVISMLGTVTKVVVQWLEDLEIRERLETIQTTVLLRLARILRRVLETWGDLLSHKTPVKNSQIIKTIIISAYNYNTRCIR